MAKKTEKKIVPPKEKTDNMVDQKKEETKTESTKSDDKNKEISHTSVIPSTHQIAIRQFWQNLNNIKSTNIAHDMFSNSAQKKTGNNG